MVAVTDPPREVYSPTIQRVQRVVDAVYQRLVGAVTSVEVTAPLVALTFDDGPHPASTPQVLQLLERYNAKATFFLVGAAARRSQELVRQIAEAGHAIGNHSWDHTSFDTIGGVRRRRQMQACQRIIAPYGLRLFRPPYGHQTVGSHLDAALLGFKVIAWSLSVADWSDPDAERMARRLIASVRPGSIVLLHDAIFRVETNPEIQYDRQALIRALELFLEDRQGRFELVTVPELMARGRPVVREWYDDSWADDGTSTD
jgi:peptidoglycan/xylan/chitin deacetylase (PgdA/CDA1 family)